MKAIDCVQRSEAWRLARCGFLTASRARDILARGRDGAEAVSLRHYRRQLLCERLTRIPHDDRFVSGPMLRGREKEAAARGAYAERTGLAVETTGFVVHDELRAGFSLDGHVGAFEGVVEIKAPNTATHLFYLTRRRLPAPYRAQITHHLWITGAEWCDFVSYDDRLPARLQLLVVRVWRDQVDVAGYERAARRFLAEIDEHVAALAVLPPVAFFQAAPLDVAREILERCEETVKARLRAPRPLPARAPWQPALGLSGRAS